ncbi:hypothetical protein M9978_07310 [Sphingomonas sp. MG17]|uniref:Uncharacterized protein n=1 Tax=Sphingomonas tagetis TaxID=2949092 RepID=A0A9X2HPN1_9SPHN|nr:hypothetical protein [Sphingomonas tagetis]MCP3730235.1 hypothetical protein [Sphingomonas tagetis]
MIRKLIVLLASAVLIGFAAGPLAAVAAHAAMASSDEPGSIFAAGRLLDTMGEQNAEFMLRTSILLDYSGIEECGYSFDQLFEGKGGMDRYFSLELIHRAGAAHRRSLLRERQASHLTNALTPFQINFLNGCIRETVAARICGKYAQAKLAGPISPDPAYRNMRANAHDTGRQARCRFLDGVAARAKLPLADQPK